MAMTNILPDPNNPINATGAADAGGTPGPGYSNVKLNSNQPIMRDRTNSGRVSTRGVAAQYWDISIGYNPMTRTQFNIIYAFLLSKRGGLKPFFVSLPQYLAPQNVLMTTNPVTITTIVDPGSDSIPYSVAAGAPSIGDLFTVQSTDTTHTKAYIVTTIDAGTITISPPVSKLIEIGATLVFHDPKLRVILDSDVQEYSLGNSNLYAFSLKLTEAQA